uniref:CCHC-type domain-containing protein n=1 Tax=Heterorhabditis bacteriophora TaxID=37862 RepID=A0A1I7XR36_HETBA
MDEPKVSSPVFVDPVPDQISDDDDLPVGADYRTVMKEAKMTINISSSLQYFLLRNLCILDHILMHFLCQKKLKKMRMTVIAVKGKGDFVPRNLKVKSSNNDSPVPPTQVVINQSEVEPATNQEASIIPNIKAGSPSEVSEEEFGPVMPPPTKDPEPEPISDGELEKEIEREIQEAGRNEKKVKTMGADKDFKNKFPLSLFYLPAYEMYIFKTIILVSKESDKRTRKRRRSRSTSPDTDQEIKARASRYYATIKNHIKDKLYINHIYTINSCRSANRIYRRSRSPDRNRDWRRNGDLVHDAATGLVGARPGVIHVIGLGVVHVHGVAVEIDTAYCQKIQRKQDKEDRREKGETVSSDDEASDDEKNSSNFKHPFGVKAAEPIKINIVNATPIPTKTSQERVLDSSQLRIVFPVSSGAVHKERKREWLDSSYETRTIENVFHRTKKYVAITSMDAEKARQHEKKATSISSLSLPLLPPPPLPPVLTGLGGLLPPPPPPPKLTAFDCLLPPPPPLPPMLIIPSEENLIMSEPIRTETAAPKDVSRVLAQRAAAQRTLNENPNDFDAIKKLKDADDQMEAWAATKNLPGKFTGSTGLNILKPEELQPQDPRYNAWVRKVRVITEMFGGFELILKAVHFMFLQDDDDVDVQA